MDICLAQPKLGIAQAQVAFTLVQFPFRSDLRRGNLPK